MWWHTVTHGRGKWRGKLANAVGNQYHSHYLGTRCIQHYYRWYAHLGCQQSTELTPLADLNGFVRFAERRNLVSARRPTPHSNWPLIMYRIFGGTFCLHLQSSGSRLYFVEWMADLFLCNLTFLPTQRSVRVVSWRWKQQPISKRLLLSSCFLLWTVLEP